jgi:hypothetical protein
VGFRETFNNFQTFTRRLCHRTLVVGLLFLIGFSLTDLGVNLTLGSWDPKPNSLKQFNAEWRQRLLRAARHAGPGWGEVTGTRVLDAGCGSGPCWRSYETGALS